MHVSAGVKEKASIPEAGTAAYTNNADIGELEISKTVSGTEDKTKEFSFEVTLTPETGKTLGTSYPAVHSGDSTITSVAVSGGKITGIILKTGEKFTIKELPAGTGYMVKEVNIPDGYTQTIPTGEETGTIAKDTTAKAAFTNEYDAAGTTPLTATKSISGRDFQAGDKWIFTVTAASRTPMPTTTSVTIEPTSGKTAPIDFGTIEYGLADVGKTYTYTITETGTVDGVTNDSTKAVTVKVSDNGDGTLKIENSCETTPVEFINTYNANGETTLKGTKVIAGREFQDGDEWTFTVTAQPADVPKPEKTSITVKPKSGSSVDLDFGKIQYTLADAGKEYVYTISESGKVPYVQNDTDKVVRIRVDTDGTSKLVIKNSTSDNPLVFTNKYDNGNLAVTKTVAAASPAEPDKVFAFTVTLADDTISGTYGEMTFSKGVAMFALKNGETKTAKGLPNGLGYTVTEEIYEGYTTQAVNANGTISGNYEKPETKTAEFVNTYKAEGKIAIEGVKTLVGRELKADEFTFQLKDYEGNVIETVTNKDAGKITFKEITYTAEDVAKSPITYTVSEVKGTEEGITYDEHVETIQVTLKDDGKGTITATANRNGNDISFINTYSAKGEFIPGAKKVLEGRTLKEGEFSFELKDADGNVLETAKNAADGSVTFSKIEYTLEDVAKSPIKYTISEVKGTDESVTYDEHIETITVTLADDGKGGVTVTADKAIAETVFTNTYAATGSYPPGAVKMMEGRDLKADEFSFELKDKDGTVLQTAKNAADGTITFAEIDYTLDDVALSPITYTISEIAGEDKTVAYDAHVEMIVVTLTDNGDGTITAEADKAPEELVFTNKCSQSVFVKKIDVTTEEELDGAVIQVIDSEGNVVDEWTSDKNEAHEIKDLKIGEEYTLRETVAPHGYDVTTDTTFTIDESGNVTTNGSLTYDEEGHVVLLVEDEMFKATAAIRKVWDDDGNRDGVRPVSLTVNLLADGVKVKTVTLTATNGWICVVRDLPKVDKELKDIEYTWEEPAAGNGYTLGGTVTKGTLTTITNVHGPEKTSVSVRKVWDDAENAKRPAEIRVQLYGDGRAVGKAVTLNATNGWKYTWEGLDKNCNTAGTTGTAKAIAYTVEELEIPEGYQATITGNAETGFVITNRLERGKLVIKKTFDVTEPEPEEEPEEELTNYTVNKIWVDNDNQDGIRPGSVTVHLFAGGSEIDSTVLSEANGWQHTFTDLPMYFKGNRIRYTVTEDPVEGYTTQINGHTIRNIHKPEEVSISVRKVWDDKDNAADLRPTSIRCTLSNGISVLLKAESGWTATVSGLPKYANGQEIVYTWTEQEIVGYKLESRETKGTVTTFTNTLVGIPEPPEGYKKPRMPGGEYAVFEEYATALGIQVYINHVGDCFD